MTCRVVWHPGHWNEYACATGAGCAVACWFHHGEDDCDAAAAAACDAALGCGGDASVEYGDARLDHFAFFCFVGCAFGLVLLFGPVGAAKKVGVFHLP